MFTSWYLSSNAPGVEKLFLITAAMVAVYCLISVAYGEGRTRAAIKRSAIGLLCAELMTEFAYYMSYMEYFNGLASPEDVAKIFPGILLPIIFFLCAWLFVKILNNMFR